MDIDEYEAVTKRPLRLHGEKSKRKTRLEDKNVAIRNDAESSQPIIISTATKAEQAFKSRQNRIAEKRILEKASKSHKQRVEEFNKHLDSLSEHYDIPKVSWTK